MAISGSIPSGISVMNAKGTTTIGGDTIKDILHAAKSGSTNGSNSLSGLGGSGSGKTMDRKELASAIRKTIGDNPDMSSNTRSAMAKLANKIDGTNGGNSSGSFGLSNNQGNKSAANSLRDAAKDLNKAADKMDGGNSAQNNGGYGLKNGSGDESQDPLQQLMKKLGLNGGNSGKLSSADTKAVKQLLDKLKEATSGQNGGNSLQSGGDDCGCDDEGSSNGLEAGSGSGDQISKEELGKDLKEFGEDLMKGGNSSPNGGLGNNSNSTSINLTFN